MLEPIYPVAKLAERSERLLLLKCSGEKWRKVIGSLNTGRAFCEATGYC